MSINYFPTPYEDELLYSVLARYHRHSGNISYTQTAEQLFEDTNCNPSIEFVNALSKDVLTLLENRFPMKELIVKHTLFPYYGRFLSSEERKNALNSLGVSKCQLNTLFEMPNYASKATYLRYCPFCVKEDRQKYNETYWHRSHQLPKVMVCPKHHCHLKNSTVELLHPQKTLRDAEHCLSSHTDIKYCSNMENAFAEYVLSVFHSPLDMNHEVNVGQFFHYRLVGTPYLSHRGTKRLLGKLFEDITAFYQNSCIHVMPQKSHLDRIFRNAKSNLSDLCQLAFFLGIPSEDLVRMETKEISLMEEFDETVKSLHSQGYTLSQIIKTTGASKTMILKILHDNQYKGEQKAPNRTQKNYPKDWSSYDASMLPLVIDVINRLQSESDTPIRITPHIIEKELGMTSKRLQVLPLCRMEIAKHEETFEQYWARKITWALQKMQSENENITWNKLQNLAYIRKNNLAKCLPYMNDETRILVQSLI